MDAVKEITKIIHLKFSSVATVAWVVIGHAQDATTSDAISAIILWIVTVEASVALARLEVVHAAGMGARATNPILVWAEEVLLVC